MLPHLAWLLGETLPRSTDGLTRGHGWRTLLIPAVLRTNSVLRDC
jgi:hypothetical protein